MRFDERAANAAMVRQVDFERQARRSWIGCSGDCSQGRRACNCQFADTLPSGPVPLATSSAPEHARRRWACGRDARVAVAIVGAIALWAVLA